MQFWKTILGIDSLNLEQLRKIMKMEFTLMCFGEGRKRIT